MNLKIETAIPQEIRVTKDTVISYTLYHVKHPSEIQEVVRWCDTVPEILVDTETSGIDVFSSELATIQVGYPEGPHPAAFVIDYRMFTAEQLAPLYAVFENPDKPKLGQNIKFELLFLRKHAGTTLENVKDTFVTEFLLRAGLFSKKNRYRKSAALFHEDEDEAVGFSECSMAALCRRYLGITIDKGFEVRTSFYTTEPGTYSLHQLQYAAGDVIYPFYVFKEQELEIHARKLASVLAVEFGFINIAAEIQLQGFRLDTVKWRQLWQEAEEKRKAAEVALHAMLFNKNQKELFPSGDGTVLYPKKRANKFHKLNLDSPEQLQWAIKQYCQNIGWNRNIVTTKKELNALKLREGAAWIRAKYEKQKVQEPWNAFLAREIDNFPDWLIDDSKHTILVSTGKDVLRLAQIRGQLPRELVDLLLEYGKYSTAVSTFGNDFITNHVNREDGRVHPQVNQNMTSTGRTSMTPNLQNIPGDPRYRKCFIPRDGYAFVIADYSQQEPRITAQECQDPVYLKTFINDEDIYLNVAETLLGYRPDVNSSDPVFAARSKRDRQLVKVIVLAMAYRMGPLKLWHNLLLAFADDILSGKMEPPTYEEVKELHEKFLATFQRLVEYQDFCSTMAHPTETPRPKVWDRMIGAYVTWATARCGRKRFFPPDSKKTYTEAANSPIQGCAATMSKAAAVMISRYIKKHGIDAAPVDLVHDELVYECREDQAEAFAQVVKHYMEKAGAFYLPDVPIKADFPKNTNGVVHYWTKEMKTAA